MRIAVSGTHCSGKSTLIDAFVGAHPEYVHEPEPYVWLEELYGEHLPGEPGVADFYRQLEISVERLRGYERGAHVIAERSPLDFVAYIQALDDLGRDRGASDIIERAVALAASGMSHIDLLVVLPSNDVDGISAPEDEDLELRKAMNESLIDIVTLDRFDLLARGSLNVAELHGTPQRRLAELERLAMETR